MEEEDDKRNVEALKKNEIDAKEKKRNRMNKINGMKEQIKDEFVIKNTMPMMNKMRITRTEYTPINTIQC